MAKIHNQKKGRDQMLATRLLDLVHARETGARDLRLRDLHVLLDIPQPAALRLAYALEQEDKLAITRDMHDPLASRLSTTPATARHLSRGTGSF